MTLPRPPDSPMSPPAHDHLKAAKPQERVHGSSSPETEPHPPPEVESTEEGVEEAKGPDDPNDLSKVNKLSNDGLEKSTDEERSQKDEELRDEDHHPEEMPRQGGSKMDDKDPGKSNDSFIDESVHPNEKECTDHHGSGKKGSWIDEKIKAPQGETSKISLDEINHESKDEVDSEKEASGAVTDFKMNASSMDKTGPSGRTIPPPLESPSIQESYSEERPEPEPIKTPRTPMGPSTPSVPSLVQGRSRSSSIDADEADDMVLATFVVRFDTLQGNVVEWTCPENVDLSGLEFAALPSGLHLVDRDCVYFSKNTYYGVSIFENYALGNDPAAAAERGARMAAAGILAPRYPRLHRHVEFLREAISYHAIDPAITQQLLAQYYNQHRRSNEGSRRRPSLQSSPSQLMSIPRVRRLHAHHPARHFGRLLERLGPSVFSLWKYSLLSKRILFSSTPPLEPLGNYGKCVVSFFLDGKDVVQVHDEILPHPSRYLPLVYSTCLMAAVASDLIDKPYPPEVINPLFCVGINDVMRLSVLDHYVACMTCSG